MASSKNNSKGKKHKIDHPKENRIGRKKWWTSTILPSIALGVSLYFVAQMMNQDRSDWLCLGPILFLTLLIAYLVTLIPASIKRLHDINKSGWFMLLAGIPFLLGRFSFILVVIISKVNIVINSLAILLGLFFLYLLGFQKGTVGPNDYGDDPS